MTQANLNQQLMDALDFTVSDLDANRQGRLSDSQRSRLATRRLVLVLVPLSLGMLAALFAPAMLDDILPVWILLPMIAGAVVSGLIALRSIPRVTSDLIAGDVLKVEGQPRFTVNPGLAAFTLHIDDRTFSCTTSVSQAFVEGARYRIFYAPRTHTLLSAERLENKVS